MYAYIVNGKEVSRSDDVQELLGIIYDKYGIDVVPQRPVTAEKPLWVQLDVYHFGKQLDVRVYPIKQQ